MVVTKTRTPKRRVLRAKSRAAKPTPDEPPVHRVYLSKKQKAAIEVLRDAKSSGRETTAAQAVFSPEPLHFQVIAQDTEPGSRGKWRLPDTTLPFVLHLTTRQYEALCDVVDQGSRKDKTHDQGKLQQARQILTSLVVIPSADYVRESPPLIERFVSGRPRPPKIAKLKPEDFEPRPNITWTNGETGQPTTLAALYAKQQAAPQSDFLTAFSYFGGKSKIAHLYPEPYFHQIIEPFAGGASYSLLYSDHDVWLNDSNPATVAIWRFLLRKDALKIIRERVPESVKRGATIDELTKDTDPEGLVELIRAHASQGSFGRTGARRKVTPWGAAKWHTLRQRLEYWVPRIAHWKVTGLDYRALPNKKACWFIDPPYANEAGATYAKGAKDIDYEELATWCKSRRGQAIVCENPGADWLPFKTLTDKRRGIYTDDVISTKGEVIWTWADEKRGLWAD